MPHWHPDEVRTVAILSGTFYFDSGDKWDESKFKAYPAGTFESRARKSAALHVGEGRGGDYPDYRR